MFIAALWLQDPDIHTPKGHI